MAFIDALARRQLSPAALDTVLAVVFAAGGLAAREDAPAEYVKEPGLAGILLILLSTLPLAAHHRRPLPVLLTLAAAVLALRGWTTPGRWSGPGAARPSGSCIWRWRPGCSSPRSGPAPVPPRGRVSP